MKGNGIITAQGDFIPCAVWQHIQTAMKAGQVDYLICRVNSFDVIVDLVCDINRYMLTGLFEWCTTYGYKVEDVVSSELEWIIKNEPTK